MDSPPDDIRLVKKKELAELLSISPRTIDNWVSKRMIPYISLSPRLNLFDPVAVRKVVTERFTIMPR